MRCPAGQGLDDPILAAVGVLILVDQQVVEAAGLGLPRPWETCANSSSVQQQQVVEIDGAGRLQGVLIAAIGGGGQMLLVGLGQRGGLARAEREAVFQRLMK